MRHAYGPSAADVVRAYNDLFRISPLAVRTEHGLFACHTLVPGRWLPAFDPARLTDEAYPDAEYGPGGLVYAILWGRDTSEETAAEFARKVGAGWLITGHIATDAGFLLPNPRQVIVDCAGTPAAYLRVPADRPISREELAAGVVVL